MANDNAFTNHLKENLSAAVFEQLHQHLGCTKYRIGTLLKGNEDWYLDEIGKVAALLDAEPVDLIMQFGLGHKYITLSELNSMVKDQGMAVGLVAHAA